MHSHVRAEAPGLHARAEVAQSADEALVDPLPLLGRSGGGKAGTVAT